MKNKDKTEMGTTVIILLTTCFLFITLASSDEGKGKWKLLKRSIGVSAMHMALLPNDRIIIFDRSNFGPSNITLGNGKCGKDIERSDCYAHSVEFDPTTTSVRPLTILTDTWCSSGSLSPQGVLLQTGGYKLGQKVVRYFNPCSDCDWVEEQNGLISPRWYATNQILPDGKIIVVGGRYEFSYEFIPKKSVSDFTLYKLPFLKQTMYSLDIPNNLYPFLHLSTDGNLFVFANDNSILLDYVNNRVIRNYPVMPGGVSRNYPSTGSSVLLPMFLSSGKNNVDAEVLICGGAQPDSNEKANVGIFLPASKSCGRMMITDENPRWVMEEMPRGRVMGDMVLLPTGDVLIINGASKGSAGWGVARQPVLNPLLYKPGDVNRFEVLSPSRIPRLYHSTALLLSDGRVLVGGSNPNMNYNFSALYPTELSLQAFYPPYLMNTTTTYNVRPTITKIRPSVKLGYKQRFAVEFQVENGEKELQNGKISVTMMAPSFNTHSFSMNQRLLVLGLDGVEESESLGGNYVVNVYSPETSALAPPGYYLLFVVDGGVPSKGRWVQIE